MNSSEISTKDTDKCPVCIQQITEPKSFSSGCFHEFCFECIFRWSQIKKECPLCKRPFDRIIFSVQNSLQFRECHFKYFPEESSQQVPLQIVGFIPGANSGNVNSAEACPNRESSYSRASWVVYKEKAPIEFRMMVYLQKWHSFSHHSQSYSSINSLGEDIQEQEENESNEILCCINYRRCLTFRDTTYEWYRANPAHAYRLEPFIDRELKALRSVLKQEAPKQPAHLTRECRISLTNSIIETCQNCWINSEEFLDMLKEFIRPYQFAEHFQHELYNYARSVSYHLTDYDAKCVYYSSEFPSKLNESTPPTALSVNLNKYRLLSKPNDITITNQQKQHSLITINETEEQVNEPTVANDSDDSSFCEEVVATPKQSPSYIIISSSSSRSRSRSRHSRSKSKRAKKSNKPKKKKKKHYERSESPKRRYKSRSLSFTRGLRFRTRTRSRSRSTSPKRRSRTKSRPSSLIKGSRTRSRSSNSPRTSTNIKKPKKPKSDSRSPSTRRSKKNKKKKTHRQNEPSKSSPNS